MPRVKDNGIVGGLLIHEASKYKKAKTKTKKGEDNDSNYLNIILLITSLLDRIWLVLRARVV